MREFKAKFSHLTTERGQAVTMICCGGIVNAVTRQDYLDTLQRADECGTHVLFDFSELAYINSSALGELALLHHQLGAKQLGCSLCRVHPDSLFLINLIGLDRILPVFCKPEDALREFDGLHAPAVDLEALRGKAFPAEYEEDLLARGRILLSLAEDNPLLPLLEEVIANNRGHSIRGCTPPAAMRALDGDDVWLAVLDNRNPDYADIEQIVRLHPEGALSCRVLLGDSPSGRLLLRGSPSTSGFSVAELAALARLEGRRRQYAEALLEREILIELRSDSEACEMGRVICERLALTTGMPREEADSFFFAVREAVDNACAHGNRLDRMRKVTIHYLCGTDAIEVRVSDEGEGFAFEHWLELGRNGNPLLQARQRKESGLKGGLGVMLMCRCCDEVEYLPPGNQIRLRKHLEEDCCD